MLEKCVVGEKNETARGKEEKLRILIWRQHVIGEPHGKRYDQDSDEQYDETIGNVVERSSKDE